MALPLALTLGEPTGIAPELALKVWLQRLCDNVPPFLLYADPQFMQEYAQTLGWTVPIEVATPETTAATFAKALPVRPLEHRVQSNCPPALNAPAVIESIDLAVQDAVKGRAQAVVTNPIAKSYLMAQGFAFPGHTEYLGALAHQHGFPISPPVMMLWCDELAVIPITVHMPLQAVPTALTHERIVHAGRTAHHHFKTWFGIEQPRLAFTGLNPHAGEDGLLGNEENTTIAPALAALRAEGIDAQGPFPADTLFHAAARQRYDVALAMYHDQALIPIKTLAFDRGVNVTLGLPFVRTSPDHGTAFDIAGKGCADPSSLLAALRLANRLTVERSA